MVRKVLGIRHTRSSGRSDKEREDSRFHILYPQPSDVDDVLLFFTFYNVCPSQGLVLGLVRRTSAGYMIVIELSVICRSLMTVFAVQSTLNSILALLSSFL